MLSDRLSLLAVRWYSIHHVDTVLLRHCRVSTMHRSCMLGGTWREILNNSPVVYRLISRLKELLLALLRRLCESLLGNAHIDIVWSSHVLSIDNVTTL